MRARTACSNRALPSVFRPERFRNRAEIGGMTTLYDLLENRVGADEIDELGHLSVPFYEARALSASRALAEQLGVNLTTLSSRGIEFTLVDAYMRNLREQFEGAPLLVRGGVLHATPGRMRFYQEIANTEQQAVSATFVYEFELQDQRTRASIRYDDEQVARAGRIITSLPEHGQPRSIDLDRPVPDINLAQARSLELELTQPRAIEPNECDETGVLLREQFSHLPYSGIRLEELATQWVFETADGRTLGMADLETRNTLRRLPHVGDQIQTFRAEVAIARKTFQRNQWVFNVDSGQLISTASVVSVALDLDARRAVDIPTDMRKALEERYHPEFL